MGNFGSIESQAKDALDENQFQKFETIIDDPKNNNIDFFKLFVFDNETGEKRDLIAMILCKNPGRLTSQSRLNLLRKIKSKLDRAEEGEKKDTRRSPQHPQLDQMMFSYIEYAAIFQPNDVELFNYVLDNLYFEQKEDSAVKNNSSSSGSRSSISVRLLCSLASRPLTESIEMIRSFLSSGKMCPSLAHNHNNASTEDNIIRISRCPLQIACACLNVDAVREFCVAGISRGAGYFDCVEALFKKEGTRSAHKRDDEKAANILLTLLAQPGFDKKEILQGSKKHKMEHSLQKYLRFFEVIIEPPEKNTLVLSARCCGWTQFAACLVTNGAPDFPEHSLRSLKLERACFQEGEYTNEKFESALTALKYAFSNENDRYRWMLDLNYQRENRGSLLGSVSRWGESHDKMAKILIAHGAKLEPQ